MPANLRPDLPEVFLSSEDISVTVSRSLKEGRLRKIGSKLYTRNLVDPPEQIVRRHLWPLVAAYIPGALIADRTAIENAPASDGSIFVISDRKRDIEMPGVTIRTRKGVAPLPSDRPFIAGLHLSSPARAYLENMRPSRRRDGKTTRTLSSRELEESLERLLRRSGEEALNRLRDEARTLARPLQAERELEKLSKLISALLGTREAKLATPIGKARRAGLAFDPDRIKLFEILHAELRNWPPTVRLAPERSGDGRATLAFFEAYFSNFIEGTEFEVSEAAEIVFNNRIPVSRPLDAHDILGTWRLVSDPTEMARLPRDAAEFLALLRSRHSAIMHSRADKRPGEFKTDTNRAGNTVFVSPDLVHGTLEHGYEIYRSLDAPFSRAVFMMFLVAEVHPFADGNGRVARVMMNAELIAAGEERIVVPTVYRANYLSALKALSQVDTAEPVIRMLDYAQRWTAAITWNDFDRTHRMLESCNAFVESKYADEAGIRLKMPEA